MPHALIPTMRVALTVLLVALLGRPAPAQCLELIFQEDFEGGVVPSGWTSTGSWTVEASPPGSCVDCSTGFAVSSRSAGGSCLCGTSYVPCEGKALESPAIALPALAPGQALILDFCTSAFLNGLCYDSLPPCNRLEVLSATASATYVLGDHIFSACPGPETTPPYDLSAFAGQVVTLKWSIGCVDDEGQLRFGLDTIRLYHALTPGPDCNGNLLPDQCEALAGLVDDCNANLIPDDCELDAGSSPDCNENGVPDECDIAAGAALDCDADGVPDACAIDSNAVPDCNDNGVPDSCDVATGTSVDFDQDGIPDTCQCDLTAPFCFSGTNSLGKKARIGYMGPTSLTLDELSLTVVDAVPRQVGLFLMAPQAFTKPFGGGFLCIAGGVDRLLPPAVLDASGSCSFALDLADPDSPLSVIQPYSKWNFQFCYRDPFSATNTFNLTDALRVHFCP